MHSAVCSNTFQTLLNHLLSPFQPLSWDRSPPFCKAQATSKPLLSLAPTFTALANFLQPPAAIGSPGEEANNVPQTVYLLLRYSLFSVDDVGKADIGALCGWSLWCISLWLAIMITQMYCQYIVVKGCRFRKGCQSTCLFICFVDCRHVVSAGHSCFFDIDHWLNEAIQENILWGTLLFWSALTGIAGKTGWRLISEQRLHLQCSCILLAAAFLQLVWKFLHVHICCEEPHC